MPVAKGTPLKGDVTRDVQFGVRIPRELKQAIEDHKAQTGRSMSDIAIEAFKQYLRAGPVSRPATGPVPVRQLYKGAP